MAANSALLETVVNFSDFLLWVTIMVTALRYHYGYLLYRVQDIPKLKTVPISNGLTSVDPRTTQISSPSAIY